MPNNRYLIPSTDSRLGRHVNHDPRSRAYAYRAPEGVTYVAVKHERHAPVFDQGDLGSCTGNAAVGCMATGEFYATVSDTPPYTLSEDGAVACYEKATDIDPYPGQYPPTDTGSDGNSVALALKDVGMISGYTHAFTFDDAMAALQQQPVIFGLDWYENMFTPDPSTGVLTVSGALAGGHEIVLDEYDPDKQLIGFTNSWADSWGLAGRAYLKVADFKKLLARDGDVTVFTPLTAPAPTPTPTPAPTNETAQELWNALKATASQAGVQ